MWPTYHPRICLNRAITPKLIPHSNNSECEHLGIADHLHHPQYLHLSHHWLMKSHRHCHRHHACDVTAQPSCSSRIFLWQFSRGCLLLCSIIIQVLCTPSWLEGESPSAEDCKSILKFWRFRRKSQLLSKFPPHTKAWAPG